MNGAHPCPPTLSTWPIWILNCHLLATESGHFINHKRAHGLDIQLGELSLSLDNQLAQLIIKQSSRIYLSALIMPGKLLYPMLSLPDVFPP